ncbi:MAG: hypothetical protein ACHQF3_03400 [Alphaproteobacteria bacterium]
MATEKDAKKSAGARGPALSSASEPARRAREVQLADALRANLRRRKADLAGRQEHSAKKVDERND